MNLTSSVDRDPSMAAPAILCKSRLSLLFLPCAWFWVTPYAGYAMQPSALREQGRGQKSECRRVAQIHARVPWDVIAENQVTEGSTIVRERKARTLLSYIYSLTAYPMWIESCFGPRFVTLRWTSTMERLRRCMIARLPSVAGITASLIPMALMSMALVGSIFGSFVLSACARIEWMVISHHNLNRRKIYE